MNEDLLSRAADALRTSHDGSSPRAGATRLRVLSVAVSRRRRRRWVVAFVAPLAALVGLSAAWAASTGRMARALDAFARGRSAPAWIGTPGAPGGAPAAPPAASAERSPPAEVASVPALGVPPQIALPAPSAVTVAVPAHPSVSRAVAGVSAVAPAPRGLDGVDREADRYAVAHRAHFVARNPAAALRAWDAYLAAYPQGRFALEARYNRALALVRLGRVVDARAALEPFAGGRFDGYRAREARELLAALAR